MRVLRVRFIITVPVAVTVVVFLTIFTSRAADDAFPSTAPQSQRVQDASRTCPGPKAQRPRLDHGLAHGIHIDTIGAERIFTLLLHDVLDLAEYGEFLDLVEGADLLQLRIQCPPEDRIGIDCRLQQRGRLGVCGAVAVTAIDLLLKAIYSAEEEQ